MNEPLEAIIPTVHKGKVRPTTFLCRHRMEPKVQIKPHSQPWYWKGVCGQQHAPAALTLGKTRYLLNRRPTRQPSKSSPSLGFDPRTIQSIASHYTNQVIPAANYTDMKSIIHKSFSYQIMASAMRGVKENTSGSNNSCSSIYTVMREKQFHIKKF